MKHATEDLEPFLSKLYDSLRALRDAGWKAILQHEGTIRLLPPSGTHESIREALCPIHAILIAQTAAANELDRLDEQDIAYKGHAYFRQMFTRKREVADFSLNILFRVIDLFDDVNVRTEEERKIRQTLINCMGGISKPAKQRKLNQTGMAAA